MVDLWPTSSRPEFLFLVAPSLFNSESDLSVLLPELIAMSPSILSVVSQFDLRRVESGSLGRFHCGLETIQKMRAPNNRIRRPRVLTKTPSGGNEWYAGSFL
uniref:Uncharacterized protein n=1 Tax=Urocitellus parryii TaxID=9999 RepID=A0A8D2HCW8_UROPR